VRSSRRPQRATAVGKSYAESDGEDEDDDDGGFLMEDDE
jgi:hypothetical protein